MTNRPVQCVKCSDIHVITSQPVDKETGLPRWRYTCLDCRVAWWVDEHGDNPDDFRQRDTR